MGDNTLYNAVDGTIIQAADVNQYKTASIGDIVPRTTTGVPQNEAGSVGSSIYRFLNGWFDKIFGLTQIDFETDLEITENGNRVGYYDADGFDGQYVKTSSMSGTAIVDTTLAGSKLQNTTVTNDKLAVVNKTIGPYSPAKTYSVGETTTSASITTAGNRGILINFDSLIVNTVERLEVFRNGVSIGDQSHGHVDFPSSGTWTYSIQSGYGGSFSYGYYQITVVEL